MLLRFFRYGLTALAGATLAPAVGEFWIELVREHGFYQHPTARVMALISFVATIRSEPWFLPAVSIITTLALVTWLNWDRRARSAERKLAKTETADEKQQRNIALKDVYYKENPDGSVTPWPNPHPDVVEHVRKWTDREA